MNRVLAVLLIVTIFVVPACGELHEPSAASELEPLRYRNQILQPQTPDAHDPLPYDEIVWPWEMEYGDPTTEGWGSARHHACQAWKLCLRDHLAYVGIRTEDGSPVRCGDPLTAQAHEIGFSAVKDVTVFDNLKYFPEVREITIYTQVSIGDSLAVLRYCPHLTKLQIKGWLRSEPPSGASPLDLTQASLGAIGSLPQLRHLSLVNFAIDDAELKQLEGMKNLLFFEIINGDLTSRSLPTIASWPRIRYLHLYSSDFSQPIDDEGIKAIESLVGRVELLKLDPNHNDVIYKPSRIHALFEPYFEKIRDNAYKARLPLEPRGD